LYSSALLAQNGQISVSVKNSSGSALSGALVTVSARPMYSASQTKPGALSFHFTGKSANGTLTVPNVPPGAYSICGRMPGSTLVDSCSWSDNSTTVHVSAGSTTPAALALSTGTVVVIHVNDNLGLLASETFQGQKLRLVIGDVKGRGVPLLVTQSAQLSRKFTAVVPVDTDLKLHVKSETLQVADSNGNKLNMKDSTSYIPLRIPAASAQTSSATATPQTQLSILGLQ
jgi:hypothetical protein